MNCPSAGATGLFRQGLLPLKVRRSFVDKMNGSVKVYAGLWIVRIQLSTADFLEEDAAVICELFNERSNAGG